MVVAVAVADVEIVVVVVAISTVVAVIAGADVTDGIVYDVAFVAVTTSLL